MTKKVIGVYFLQFILFNFNDLKKPNDLLNLEAFSKNLLTSEGFLGAFGELVKM